MLVLFGLQPSIAAGPRMTIEAGAVNQVLLEGESSDLAIYGWQVETAFRIDHVLLTHARRDVVTDAVRLNKAGVKVIAPEREKYHLETSQKFWNRFDTSRFHDYAQQSIKILSSPLTVDRWVKDGEIIEWNGIALRVIETPGYTRGAISYVTRLDNQTVAFTGDLIYGDGQLLDLYSFQDAIPEAKIGGYHGYGSRLAGLIRSLEKIAATEPDLIVPARGPVIRKPIEAIERLISRVRALYHNYLSTNALHWYFKEDRMRTCGERILGKGAEIELMPYSNHRETPAWIFEHSTSRLLISDSGHGFLLDCGYQRVIDAVDDLIAKQIVKQIDGIFVTHYHDDHSEMVQAAAEKYNCPVYATEEYADVLEQPRAYRLPAMTSNAIVNVTTVPDGHRMKWQEFDLTFHFFPGQTYYHGALFARKGVERPVFFIGDAFAPSGIDDYCLLNRNLLHDDSGYLYCLKRLANIDEPYWLVNQHIRHVFSFSADEREYLEKRYRDRIKIMRDLFPWDDPNYGVDEHWATFYPHGVEQTAGETVTLELRVTNHSPRQRSFECRLHVPTGWDCAPSSSIRLPARGSGGMPIQVTVPAGARGKFLITADIVTEGMEFDRWAEAHVVVE